MTITTDDVRIREIKELAPPSHLLREFPISAAAAGTTFESRRSILSRGSAPVGPAVVRVTAQGGWLPPAAGPGNVLSATGWNPWGAVAAPLTLLFPGPR